MLSEEQIERYARHILLREVGGVGQERLLAAAARVEGLGQVGAWAAAYLALAGVGRLKLADGRAVPPTGLAPLLGPASAGRPRDTSIAEALAAHNPDVEVEVLRAEGAEGPADASRLHAGGGALALWACAAGAASFVGWVEAPPCARCLPAAPPTPEAAALAGSLAASRLLASLLFEEPAPGILRLEGGRREVWEGCPHR